MCVKHWVHLLVLLTLLPYVGGSPSDDDLDGLLFRRDFHLAVEASLPRLNLLELLLELSLSRLASRCFPSLSLFQCSKGVSSESALRFEFLMTSVTVVSAPKPILLIASEMTVWASSSCARPSGFGARGAGGAGAALAFVFDLEEAFASTDARLSGDTLTLTMRLAGREFVSWRAI